MEHPQHPAHSLIAGHPVKICSYNNNNNTLNLFYECYKVLYFKQTYHRLVKFKRRSTLCTINMNGLRPTLAISSKRWQLRWPTSLFCWSRPINARAITCEVTKFNGDERACAMDSNWDRQDSTESRSKQTKLLIL